MCWPKEATLLGVFAGDVRVLEGHAFIVEAAISLGGRELRPGLNIYRFANRIPLLFEVLHRAVVKAHKLSNAPVLNDAGMWIFVT